MAEVLAVNGLFYSPNDQLVRCCSCFAGQSVSRTIIKYSQVFVDSLVEEIISNIPEVNNERVSLAIRQQREHMIDDSLFAHDTLACSFQNTVDKLVNRRTG